MFLPVEPMDENTNTSKIASLRRLHQCLLVLPPDISKRVAQRALWIDYRLGEGRILNRRTLRLEKNRALGD